MFLMNAERWIRAKKRSHSYVDRAEVEATDWSAHLTRDPAGAAKLKIAAPRRG
jgi:hypothetical protein